MENWILNTGSGHKPNRVFLLCVDGLEYNFVNSRHFPNIKQKQFFKVKIPIHWMSELKDGTITPYTPVIWRGILTGEVPQTAPISVHKSKAIQRWDFFLLNWLKRFNLTFKIYSYLLNKGVFQPGLPKKFGFYLKQPIKHDKTFLGFANNPIVVHHPLQYYERWETWERLELREIVSLTEDFFKKERELTLKMITGEWDLFLSYTRLLDIIGHIYWQKSGVMEKYYNQIEDFVKQIKQRLPPNTNIIILSDHGMKALRDTKYQGGEHSRHAFASFSHSIKISKPLEISDLYSIIISLLNGSTGRRL